MITILFGSGADTDYYGTLPSGNAFSKELLKDGFKEERRALLGDIATNFRLIYPTSRNVFLQTICEYQDEAAQIMGMDCVDKALKYYQRNVKDDEKGEIANCISGYCLKWYDETIHGSSEIAKFFLDKALFFDSLDEKFNALRKTPVESKGLRVINAYYTILLQMIQKLYYDSFASYEAKNISFQWLFNLLNQPYEIQPVAVEGSYYRTTRKLMENCCIATTNYTKLVADAFETDKQSEICYLHGKLTWFEDLDDLAVYDIELDNEKATITSKNDKTSVLPFILIPSGVKPIICKRQLDEFFKFSCMLEKSDIVCTIGYKCNLEDNHINSLIADWLRKNEHNRLIYFNYNGEVDLLKCKWLHRFTMNHIDGNVFELFNLLKRDTRVIDVFITKENARKVFSDFVEEMKNYQRTISNTCSSCHRE